MDFGIRRIIINTAAGTWAKIGSAIVSLLTTPILFNYLGPERFGLFAILGSLGAYAGLFDFGIGPGLVKHLTEYSERNNILAVRHVTTFAILFYLIIGILLTPLVYLSSPSLIKLLPISSEAHSMARVCITAMFIYFVLSSISGIFSARLVSLHRMDITAAISLAGQLVYGASVFFLIPVWPTVIAAISLVFLQLIFSGLATLLVVVRVDSKVLADPRTIPTALIRKLLTFGGWMQLNSLSGLINLETDKLIIGAFVDFNTVAFYEIGNKLAALNRVGSFQLLSALMPTATMLNIKNDTKEIEDFYRHTSRYLMLTTLMISGFISVAANQIISVWLGKSYGVAVYTAIALSFSFAVNSLTGVGTTIVRAFGLPRYETYYAWISTTLNIIITIALAKPFGIVGILAGTIIGNVIGSIYFLAIFHRIWNFSWTRSVGAWLWKIVAAMVFACGSVRLFELAYPAGSIVNRWLGLSLIGASGLLYGSVFISALTLLSFWTDEDLDAIRRARRHLFDRKAA